MSSPTEFLAPIAEVKLAGCTSARSLTGYAAVFDNIDTYGDLIAHGAFRRTLSEIKTAGRWPPMLMQHGFAASGHTPIGVWTNMAEDDRGLAVEGRLSDTPSGNEAYTLLKDGALSGLSIGFVAKDFSLGSKPNEPRRTLTDVTLHEVSLVTFPANDRARVTGVKSLGEITPRLLERAMIAAGCPRSLAKSVLAVGWSAAARADDGDTEALAALVEAVKANTAVLSCLRNPRREPH